MKLSAITPCAIANPEADASGWRGIDEVRHFVAVRGDKCGGSSDRRAVIGEPDNQVHQRCIRPGPTSCSARCGEPGDEAVLGRDVGARQSDVGAQSLRAFYRARIEYNEFAQCGVDLAGNDDGVGHPLSF